MGENEQTPAERVLDAAADVVADAEHEVSLENEDQADDARTFGELPAAERAEYDQAQAADIEHVRQTGELPWGSEEFVFGGVTYGPDMIVENGDVRAKTAAEIAADEEYRRPVYAELARLDAEKEAARVEAERERRAGLSPQERADEDAARYQARAGWDAVWGKDGWGDDDAAGM